MGLDYSPYYTSEAAGETLNGTMVNDRASGPDVPLTYETAVGPASAVPAPSPGAAPDYGNMNIDEIQAARMAQKAQAEEPPSLQSIMLNADGSFTAKGSQRLLAELMGQQKDLNTMKAAAMARVAQLRQQESSGSPILDALSQIAGGMAANDPTMPGWVRALGATNLAMGPQGIKRERMLEEQKALQYGQAGANLAQQMLENQQKERGLNIAELNAYGNLQGKALDQKIKFDTGADAVMKDIEKFAKDRIPLSADDIAKRFKMRGVDDPTIVADAVKFYGNLRDAADKAYDEARADKRSDAEAKALSNLAVQKVLAGYRSDLILGRGKELADYRNSLTMSRAKEMVDFNAATKDLEPFRKLTTPEQTQLHDMTTNLEYLKSLKAVVNDPKTAQYLGPLNLARMSGEWSTLFRPDELQTVMTYYAHELPRVAKFTGAQSRAFTAAMVPVIKSLGGETSMTPSQMNNVIKIIEESTQQIQTGIAKGKPLAPFNLAPGMLGGIDSPAYKAWVDAHETALKQGGGRQRGPSVEEQKKMAQNAAIGSIVVLNGQTYRKKSATQFDPVVGSK